MSGQEVATFVNCDQHKQTREPVWVPQFKDLMVPGPVCLTLGDIFVCPRFDDLGKIHAYGGQAGGRDSHGEHYLQLIFCMKKVVLERLGRTRARDPKVLGDVLRD
jgi:hypothetical protein